MKAGFPRGEMTEAVEAFAQAEREQAAWHDDAGLATGAPLSLTLAHCAWRHAEAEAPGRRVFAIEDGRAFADSRCVRSCRCWRRRSGSYGAGFEEEGAAEHLLDNAEPAEEFMAALASDDDLKGDGLWR